MNTLELTIQLPENEIKFLKKYAEYQGLTISELINRYIKSLKLSQNAQIHPDIKKITGIIPQHIDIQKEYAKYSTDKHT